MNDIVVAGYQREELAELSEEEKQQFLAMQHDELSQTRRGVDLQLMRLKISKDTCQFVDEGKQVYQELRGVIIYKDKIRGYWPKDRDDDDDSSAPECSSVGGIEGITQDGRAMPCSECQYNKWGSAVDESGKATRGKACKEMRRIYMMWPGLAAPVFVTLPPTSIKGFDKYISARLTKGITDLAMETVITLASEKAGKFSYAVAQFTVGNRISPKDQLNYHKFRALAEQHAARTGVEADDYKADETGGEAQMARDEDPF